LAVFRDKDLERTYPISTSRSPSTAAVGVRDNGIGMSWDEVDDRHHRQICTANCCNG
jgi:HSP90 family molecular chaperone